MTGRYTTGPDWTRQDKFLTEENRTPPRDMARRDETRHDATGWDTTGFNTMRHGMTGRNQTRQDKIFT